MKVWIFIVDHRHGTNVSAHTSRQAADAANFAYCDENWGQEFAEARPPDDELVSTYWQRQTDRGDEWHMIEECDLDMSDLSHTKPIAWRYRQKGSRQRWIYDETIKNGDDPRIIDRTYYEVEPVYGAPPSKPAASPIFIPENEHGVKPGYYTIPDIVRLLRKHHTDPKAVHFIADMME